MVINRRCETHILHLLQDRISHILRSINKKVLIRCKISVFGIQQLRYREKSCVDFDNGLQTIRSSLPLIHKIYTGCLIKEHLSLVIRILVKRFYKIKSSQHPGQMFLCDLRHSHLHCRNKTLKYSRYISVTSLLFLFFVNDIIECIPNFKLLLFIDDVKIFMKIITLHECILTTRRFKQSLSQWSLNNNLFFNVEINYFPPLPHEFKHYRELRKLKTKKYFI